MMETYLTLLYVTLEQELALKDFFMDKGWTYCKPDLGVMTEKVGPFENPQAFKTKTGGIITYSEVSGKDKLEKPKSGKVVPKKKSKKVTSSLDVLDIVKVEVSNEGDFSSQSDNMANEVDENIMETDDGDNDDDYADDLKSTVEENETTEVEDSNSPVKRRRLARKTHKVEQGHKSSVGKDTPETGVNDQEVKASGSRRHRAAAKTSAENKSVMSEEKKETELKPLVLMKNRTVTGEKRPPPGVKRKCSMCPKEFTYQFNLDKHCKLAHDPENAPKPKPKQKRQKQQCDICGNVFSRSDVLLDHRRRMHQGVHKKKSAQMCTCDVCGATYKRRTHLKEHTLVKHSNIPLPHACNMCEKSFIRYRFLEAHVNRDHLKLKPFGCSFCNRKFHNEFSADKHMKLKICQADRVKKFKCIQCEKTFPNASSLEGHMTAKHFGGAYSCVCGEVVKWSGSVAKHKRKCKAYKEYQATYGETEDKLCNIIEVPYNEVLLENVESISEIANVPPLSNNDKEQTAEHKCQTDMEHSADEKTD